MSMMLSDVDNFEFVWLRGGPAGLILGPEKLLKYIKPEFYEEALKAWLLAEKEIEIAEASYLEYEQDGGSPEEEERAKKREFERKLRENVFARDKGHCRYCGVLLDASWHLEHVIPRSRGGGFSEVNLVCSCKTCNVVKGARTPEEAGMVLREVL